ncbi:hypothetical protein [Aphanothece sacrum]|uniref:Glutathione S-transferase n=1 Tax=Aphanothece sacrum FPU1 TaxID=1920663 RepID=A0A401IIU1_APHSA|nr:hypothetical protein [Aphanothece sacrum]GBF81100.1 glutathione S-transferase [Aphanothece sacrum FPU1]GBF85501.1 glutathione S-transferase [Aphanothece sacrum FPU3]
MRLAVNRKQLYGVIGMSLVSSLLRLEIAVALPPPDEIPEEVLRTEIITEGRSPLNGTPVTAAEYAQIEQKLAESAYPPQLSSNLQHLIFLLQVRKMLKTFFPL